jgi:hexosaminidase
MKRFLMFFAAVICLLLNSCSSRSGAKEAAIDPSVIPQPVMLTLTGGDCKLLNSTIIYYKSSDLAFAATYLGKELGGFKVINGEGAGINLVIADNVEQKLGSEGYRLAVRKSGITITAAKANGIFYGIQTLLQMLPAETKCCGKCEDGTKYFKCAEIEDYPRFKWRGLLLDVSRHFFTIDEIKQMIDQMVMYKFNLLQLHLTDDNGWRLEIKSMPELTATGAWRVKRTGYWGASEPPKKDEKATDGGFYTQDQIRDLVKYASERFVNILPEIEAPGHSLAAIASYPYLSSTGLKYNVNPGSRFYMEQDNSLCPGKETTFDYMDKVLTEVAQLFPFEYVHIGGDECYKGFWEKCPDCRKRVRENNLKDMNELQSYFIKRLEKILESKGKKLIGWDEILEGGLAPNAAVMSWRGMEGGIAAANAKHMVVMSPVNFAYLDYYQGDPAIEPPTFALLRLNKVYSFEPVPDGVDPAYVLGGQGNLWTESVPTFRHAEYMLWPRSFALSEIFWSPKGARDWPSFVNRTEANLKRLESKDINFATSFRDAIILPSKDEKGNLQIALDTELDGTDLFYTFDNTYPDSHSLQYPKGDQLQIPNGAAWFRVITYKDGMPLGKMISVRITELQKRLE